MAGQAHAMNVITPTPGAGLSPVTARLQRVESARRGLFLHPGRDALRMIGTGIVDPT